MKFKRRVVTLEEYKKALNYLHPSDLHKWKNMVELSKEAKDYENQLRNEYKKYNWND